MTNSGKIILCGLTAGLLLAVFISPFASLWPDGLEKVAADLGFLGKMTGGHFWMAPLPDYKMPGIQNGKIAVSLAGLAGTLAVYATVLGVGVLLKNIKRYL